MLWREDSKPGFDAAVYADTWQVKKSRGCYVTWELRRNGDVVATGHSRCVRSAGTPCFDPAPLEVGTYEITARVSTDWGAENSGSETFGVVPR